MSIHLGTGPIQITDARLRALCDLSISTARQDAGRHEYDGVVQDLSPTGVTAGLHALASVTADPQPDPHDEAQLTASMTAIQVRLGELELHRINPMPHILNLDLSCYDRDYAPAVERRAARDRHVEQWPAAVDAAIAALDRMPAPVAEAGLPLARGLASFLCADEHLARAALARFVTHLQVTAERGDPDAAMGARPLQRLLESSEACAVDLEKLAERADRECARLQELLVESCRRIDPHAPLGTTIDRLRADHPTADTLLSTTAALVEEAIAWTADSGLVPHLDGQCEGAPMPESQRWAAAGMVGAAPNEADAPSRFYVTPPNATLPVDQQELWLASYFNRATLPNIAVHEVAPGHFAHSRAWRRAAGQVRRTLYSDVFGEGWAHYAEQLALEEGFRGGDPALGVGVALDGLRRVARLRCALGLHFAEMTLDEAAATFTRYAQITGPAAYSEARRGLLDPTYGRYTWGKMAVLDLREQARSDWGTGFSLARFHGALLALGSPPLGLISTAIEGG